MRTQKEKQKKLAVEFDDIEFDLEFDELYSKYRESNSKLHRRRLTKRKLDRLKEKKWLKQNYCFDDDYLSDFDDVNIH